VGVTDDGVGHVAEEGSLQPAESAATYHDQVGVYLLGQVHDRFVSPFAHPQVGDGDDSARLFDLPDLTVQNLLSLASEGFAPLFGLCLEFVDALARKRATDGYGVEPRVGALCEFDRLHGRQLGVRGAVGGQQYPRGEVAHPLPLCDSTCVGLD